MSVGINILVQIHTFQRQTAIQETFRYTLVAETRTEWHSHCSRDLYRFLRIFLLWRLRARPSTDLHITFDIYMADRTRLPGWYWYHIETVNEHAGHSQTVVGMLSLKLKNRFFSENGIPPTPYSAWQTRDLKEREVHYTHTTTFNKRDLN